MSGRSQISNSRGGKLKRRKKSILEIESISSQTVETKEAIQKKSVNKSSQLSTNFVHYTILKSIGQPISTNLRNSVIFPVFHFIRSMEVCHSYSGFSKRVTAIDWHPTCPNTIAIGSKGGDIALWNFENDNGVPREFINGIGPGGSIQSLKFDSRNNGSQIFNIAVDGTMVHQDFSGNRPKSIYLNSKKCWEHWYTSLDISFSTGAILVGDNKGMVNLLDLDGGKQWEKRLHKQKVAHIEYSPNDPNCFVTTSTDKSIKIWDARKINGIDSYLYCDYQEKPISCASFSRVDGGTLLTTDQHSELRFYSVPSLILKRKVYHPHRQFQHLTPIKASWHPLGDIAVVGRYPDPKNDAAKDPYASEVRSIDFFDSLTGKLLYQHIDRGGAKFILSLNLFNPLGDSLISVGGTHVYISKPNFKPLQGKLLKEGNKDSNHKDSSDDDDHESKDKEAKKSTGKKKRYLKELDISSIGKKVKMK